MIHSLKLSNFGILGTGVWPLDAATVFVGGNGSGKTTLFDAIVWALQTDEARRETQARWGTRYGPACEACFVSELGPAGLGVEEVLHLHAAPWGAMVPPPSVGLSSAVVVDRFADVGVDLEEVCASLSQRGGAGSALAAELARLGEELRALEVDTVAAGQGVEAHRRWASRLTQAQQDFAGLGRDLETRGAVLVAATNALRSLQIRAALAAEDEHARDLGRLAAIPVTDDAFLAQMTALDEEITARRAMIAGLEARQGDSVRRLEQISADIARDRQLLDAGRSLAAGAAAHRVRWEKAKQGVPLLRRRRWRRPGVGTTLALLATTGSVACASLAGAQVALGVLVLGAATIVATLRTTTRVPDGAAQRVSEGALRRLWQQEWGAGTPLPEGSHDDARAFFADLVQAHERLQRRYDDNLVHKRRVEEEIEEILRCGIAALQSTLALRLETRDALLKAHQFDCHADFCDQVAVREELLARLVSRLQEAPDLSATEPLPPARRAALQAELRECVVGDTCLSATLLLERQRDALVRDVGVARLQKEALQQTYARLGQASYPLRERVRRAELAHRGNLLRLQQARRRLCARRDAVERRRQAIRGAADVLRAAAQRRPSHLAAWAARLSHYLGLIEGQPVSVRMREACFEAIDVVFSRGRCAVATLSPGCCDAVALAYRLALAEGIGSFPILAFDEPFLRLDERRRQGCLSALAAFQRQTGWQLVLCTRDHTQAMQMAGAFAARLVELPPGRRVPPWVCPKRRRQTKGRRLHVSPRRHAWRDGVAATIQPVHSPGEERS